MTPAASPPRPLPIRPRPMTGESSASYLRRLARANHLRPGYLRRYLRQEGSEGTIRLDWLAILSGRPLPALERALSGPASSHTAGRPQPGHRNVRQADKPRLFAAISRDARDSGLSIRALADRHGVHRRTVRQALASPWPAPRKSSNRGSKLDPFKDTIDAVLLSGLDTAERTPPTVKQIFDHLTTEHQMTGVSYSTVRDYLATRLPPWRSRQANPAACPGDPPGEQMARCCAGMEDRSVTESMTVTWSWQAGGQVELEGGMLVFPPVPDAAGIYRLTFTAAVGERTGVYIGETDRLPRRFQHYRTPGTDKRLTMHRLNRAMVEILSTGGHISVEVVTQAEVATGTGPPVPLDLSWKAGRVLIERAAEVRERAAGTPVLNK